MELDQEQLLQHTIQDKDVEDSIILTLAPQLEIEDEVTSSSLVRSETGQFYLITYDASDKVLSKHEINIKISTEDFLGIKYNGTSEPPNTQSALRNFTESDDFSISTLSAIPITQDVSRLQTGETLYQTLTILILVNSNISIIKPSDDALQLAMQEIENDPTELFEPVSYEVKLAALNAMIPSGEPVNGQILYNCAICTKNFDRKYELKSHLSRHFGLNIFLCPVCGRQFTHSSNLSRHLRIHSGLKPYKCKECGKRYHLITIKCSPNAMFSFQIQPSKLIANS